MNSNMYAGFNQKLLALLASNLPEKEFYNAIVSLLRELTQCKHVGLRVLTKDGYIPFQAYRGFSENFMKGENWLSIYDVDCTCTRVVKAAFKPVDIAFITQGGSCLIANAQAWASQLSQQELAYFRGNCLSHGFSTVAVIPIRVRGQIVGIVHLADEKAERVSQEMVNYIEKIAPVIGDLLVKHSLEADVQLSAAFTQNLLLELFKMKNSTNDYLALMIKFLEKCTGAACVGIRVINEDGLLPYEAYVGFSQRFWEKENLLCPRSDQCICTRVFNGTPESQDFPLITKGGSFYCKDAEAISGGRSAEERARYRGACVQEGFKTIAIIRILQKEKTMGLIHIADYNAYAVSYEIVEYLELLSPIIGEALNRFKMESTCISKKDHQKLLTEMVEKQLGAERARFDRLNMVGEMAAGIGHEVRNPLTTVRGYLQMLQRKEKYTEHQRQFATMIEELDRANAIITEFLSLAKNNTMELKLGSLNGTIHTLFPLLQADALRFGHEIKMDLGNIPVFFYDDREIRQLILNLVRNGFEAMDASGVVIIKTYSDADQIVLEVTDTGSGIPQELLNKIGTPFETTKKTGTGLGLSVCFRIAEKHKASIHINTSPKGTTFFIKFKATENENCPCI